MAARDLFGDLVQANAVQSRDGAGEVFVDERPCDSPIASNTCAPVYEATVEMPILDITLSTPLPAALMYFLIAACGSTPPSPYRPWAIRSSIDSNARYGLIAPAP